MKQAELKLELLNAGDLDGDEHRSGRTMIRLVDRGYAAPWLSLTSR
jgi:hypothetical protein